MDRITCRLGKTDFSSVDCESALKGQKLLENLGHMTVRLCLISGIRHHLAFARSPEVTELCRTAGQEIFARARNARLIMSDEVPGSELMGNKAFYPYCIWHPDVASEDTYRKLAAAYPDMRYQVGRACAVVGYDQLYRELDLLPDPCIAEEAREASRDSDGSRHIFEQIMAAPLRYSVMNDYDLTVELDRPKPGAFLNADTAVRATLKERQIFAPVFRSKRYFNINEDWGIGPETVKLEITTLTDDEADLLVSPLPFDLPTMTKDLLILMSACEGNVDRYVRLRRKGRSVQYEVQCLIPGIYRSTAMAFWLDRNPDVMHEVAAVCDEDLVVELRRGIYARHIMNNATHHLLDADPPVPDDELPYWIWYPTIPSPYTLCKLAEARAAMRPQCVRACIAGGYCEAYTKIMDMPDPSTDMPVDPDDTDDPDEHIPLPADIYLIAEAESSRFRDFFLQDMERRREEGGLKPQQYNEHDDWKILSPWHCGDPSSTILHGSLPDRGGCIAQLWGLSLGMWGYWGAELGIVRLYLSNRGSALSVPHESTIILE
ncbi:hypothetical protein V501_02896 [Pseudogymnoascus sp. VKM F-4519 (FW-2642)]|nr:hypothetical protein V501_02896 [Pseudogymnoascus sp. VKM F-4519 (FW-2642)]